MTIREVINMLKEIFAFLGEMFGGLFNKKEDGEAEGEATNPEA